MKNLKCECKCGHELDRHEFAFIKGKCVCFVGKCRCKLFRERVIK